MHGRTKISKVLAQILKGATLRSVGADDITTDHFIVPHDLWEVAGGSRITVGETLAFVRDLARFQVQLRACR